MQTIFLSISCYTPSECLLPEHVQQHWRSELLPLVMQDVRRGLFGGHTRKHALPSCAASASVLYRIDLARAALRRIQSGLQVLPESVPGEDDVPGLAEMIASTKIWLTCNMGDNAPHDAEIKAPLSGHAPFSPFSRTGNICYTSSSSSASMIGLDYDETSPRASTSSYRTLVESDAHSTGASSSTTTLVSSSSLSSASPSPRSVSMSLSHNAQSSIDCKASLTSFESQANYPTSTPISNYTNAPIPDKPSIHPRQLPLDLRFKHTSATSRARKTHVLVLDVESDVTSGASNFGVGRERRRTGSTVGQFFRALGRRANSTSTPGAAGRNFAVQALGSASEDDVEEVVDEQAQTDPQSVAAPGLGERVRVRREIDASQSLSGLIS